MGIKSVTHRHACRHEERCSTIVRYCCHGQQCGLCSLYIKMHLTYKNMFSMFLFNTKWEHYTKLGQTSANPNQRRSQAEEDLVWASLDSWLLPVSFVFVPRHSRKGQEKASWICMPNKMFQYELNELVCKTQLAGNDHKRNLWHLQGFLLY